MFRTLLLLPAVAFVMPASATAGHQHHPQLHHAVHDIRHAIAEIEGANHTHFNRHKVEAIRDLKFALLEVDKALAAIGDPVPNNFRVRPDLYRDYKDHRHLRHADQSIHAAIRELRVSEAFGGDRRHYKEKAVRALLAAHQQVQLLVRQVR